MHTATAVTAFVAAMAIPAAARAVDLPQSINEPAKGAGTEQPQPVAGQRVVPGPEAAAELGGGFTSTYGVALGARGGYTFGSGIYVGGATTYYMGHSIGSDSAYAYFLGGEVGYKVFPNAHWEIRPYAFMGPAVIKTVEAGAPSQKTLNMGFQPGVLTAYHFGNWFLSAEARAHVSPSPGAISLLGGAGLAF